MMVSITLCQLGTNFNDMNYCTDWSNDYEYCDQGFMSYTGEGVCDGFDDDYSPYRVDLLPLILGITILFITVGFISVAIFIYLNRQVSTLYVPSAFYEEEHCGIHQHNCPNPQPLPNQPPPTVFDTREATA